MKLNKTAALLVIIAVLASILGYMAYLNYQEEIKQTKEFQNIKPFQKLLAHPTLARAQQISPVLSAASSFVSPRISA